MRVWHSTGNQERRGGVFAQLGGAAAYLGGERLRGLVWRTLIMQETFAHRVLAV